MGTFPLSVKGFIAFCVVIVTVWLAPVGETAAIPSSHLVSDKMAPTSRVIRSCEHHNMIDLLFYCGRHFKRSPFIISVIFMEYYLPSEEKNEIGAIPRGVKVDGEGSSEPILTWIWAPSAEDITGEGDDHFQRNYVQLPSPWRPRRAIKKRASIHPFDMYDSVIEKCCTKKCNHKDFIQLCPN